MKSNLRHYNEEVAAKPPIMFLGLGSVGHPMALRLLREGFPMITHAITSGRAEPLVEEGATLARNIRHGVELLMGVTATWTPRMWTPGVHAREQRALARRQMGPPQPPPLLVACMSSEGAFKQVLDRLLCDGLGPPG